MSNLIERLRDLALGPNDPDARDEDRLMLTAAAEIERQEADARKVFDMLLRDHEALAQERDALRAALTEMERAYVLLMPTDRYDDALAERAQRALSASQKEQTV